MSSETSRSNATPSATVLAERYAIDAVIGEGGMGVVYAGRDLETGEAIAIKRLRAGDYDDPILRLAMAQEVRAMARLRHPGIVRVVDFGWSGAEPFLIMERVFGRPLDAFRGVDLGFPLLRSLGGAILSALAYAHAHGVVHLDLKPANVLVTGPASVKLVDFGIARREDAHAYASTFGEAPARRSEGGRKIRGSRPYMSPEQAAGDESRIGPASDLFALGVTVFLLATGRLPFTKRPLGAPLAEIARIQPRPFVPRFPVPAELAGFVADLLRADAFLRGEFAADYFNRLMAMPSDGAAALPTLASDPPPRPITDASSSATIRDPDSGAGLPSPSDDQDDDDGDAPTRARAVDRAAAFAAPSTGASAAEGRAGEPASRLRADRSRFGLFGIREPALVGRADQQAALLEPAVAVLQRGRLRVRVVRGGPGVGKSRLARWIQQRSREDGSFDGLVAVYGRGRGAGGLRGAIARWLRLRGEGQREVMHRAIERLGASTLEGYSLSGVLRPGDRRPDRAAREVLATLVHALRRIAKKRPVLLWMEDIDQAQSGSAYQTLAALAAADEVEPLPIYVVATEGDAPLPPPTAPLREAAFARDIVRVVEVAPLDDAAIAELARELLPLTDASTAALVQRVRGNPLCAMHLLAHWVDTGALADTDLGLETPIWGGEPDALAEVLSVRIDGLAAESDDPDRVLEVLERIALLGRGVDLDLVRRALDLEGRADLAASAPAAIDGWLASGILRESEPGVLDVEPRALEPILRASAATRPSFAGVQRALAEAKQELVDRGEGTPALRAEIARHLLDGGLPREAAAAAIEAGRRAPQFGLADQGLSHLAFAEGCILAAEADGEAGAVGLRARWALARSVTLHRLGRPDEATIAVHDAVVTARSLGEPTTLAMALTAEGDLLRRLGDSDAGRARLEEAAAIAAKHRLEDPLARASYSLAHLAYLRGDLGDAERLAALAYASSRGAGEVWTALWARALERAIALARGDVRGALAHIADDRHEAEASGFPTLVAQMEEHAGEIHHSRGDYATALEHFIRVREVFAMLGDLMMEAVARAACAAALNGLGRADDAEREAAIAAELGFRIGHAEVRRNAAVHRAHAALLRGDPERAAVHVAELEADGGAPLELEVTRCLTRAGILAVELRQVDLAGRIAARAGKELERLGKREEASDLASRVTALAREG